MKFAEQSVSQSVGAGESLVRRGFKQRPKPKR